MSPSYAEVTRRFQPGTLTRILAFGSSNTERRLPGMHWFDCLDLAILENYGRIHHCINAGVGGNTSRDLLMRFDRDAAFYKPHVVFITIGGNDSKPETGMDAGEFKANLTTLWTRFQDMGTQVIFQTYYAVKSDGSAHFQTFYQFADVVRDVANSTGSGLIDHLERWERLRLHAPEVYDPLMEDAFHVNKRGNKVMGVDLVRRFGMSFRASKQDWDEALRIQKLMDHLQSK